MRKMRKNEDGFTGLEAAIVLIAFVVVAAVFSYVVLGAGFFTTQKSQQVVHSGVTQAASNIVVDPTVYGIGADDNTTVGQIMFTVRLAAGGVPIDVPKTVMTFSTASATPYMLNYTSSGGEGTWYIFAQSPSSNGNDLLESGEAFTIIAQPKVNITPREMFDLQIAPEVGASLPLEKTVPAAVTATTLLY